MAQMIYREAFDLDFQLRNIFMAAELEAGEARPNAVQADVVELVTGVMTSFNHRPRRKKSPWNWLIASRDRTAGNQFL